jgi:glycosyltransferase involved in cell wall biosynthesis
MPRTRTIPPNLAVSVLVPLYNKAVFIEATICSVLAQDYPYFELLIVDDGSTDNGVARLQARFNDSRIRIIRQANAGAGAARNRALRLAQGNILAFLDADDEWSPTHLSDLLHLASEFPRAGILATRIAYKAATKLVAENTIRATCPCLIENYFVLAAQRDAWFINSSSCAIRQDVFLKVGGFLEATPYGEDQEYWARVSLSYPMAFHPRVSAMYCVDVPNRAMSLSRWNPAEPAVVHTLRQYLTTHLAVANRRDVLDYAAWVLMNQAASGVASGASRDVRKILSDPLLNDCRFQRRLRVLRLAATMPQLLTRALCRVIPRTRLWRTVYAKIAEPSLVSTSN